MPRSLLFLDFLDWLVTGSIHERDTCILELWAVLLTGLMIRMGKEIGELPGFPARSGPVSGRAPGLPRLPMFDYSFRDREPDASVESRGRPPALVLRFNPRRFAAPPATPVKPAARLGASPPTLKSPPRREQPSQPAGQPPPLASTRLSALAANGRTVLGAPPVSPRDAQEKESGYAAPELTAAIQRELHALEQEDGTDALLRYVLSSGVGE